MANELTVSIAYDYQKGNYPALSESHVRKVSISGTAVSKQRVSIGTSEEAIVLGEVTAAGAWMILKNEDDTNYVSVLASTAGTAIIKVKAGEVAIFPFGTGITAPYLLANTAACIVSYTLISAS